jgi:hypothetical protein
MHDFYSLRSKGKVKTFTICWYDWDESRTNREIRGTTGANGHKY